MNKLSFLLTIILLLILFTSCNRHFRYIYNGQQQLDTVFEYKINSEPYRLKPNDILQIKIITTDPDINALFKIDDQTGNVNSNVNGGSYYLSGFTVNDSGYVDIPILGKMYAGEKTVSEFRSEVSAKTYEYLKDAIVNVKFVSFKISFLGEVNSKGTVFIFQDNIDILEAIARAGGIAEYGNLRTVTVVRQENDKRLVYKLDLTDRALLSSNKFYLYPDDIIIVEPRKTKVARMNLRDYFFFFSAVSTVVSTTTIIISLLGKN